MKRAILSLLLIILWINTQGQTFTFDDISLTFTEYSSDTTVDFTDEFTAYGITITPTDVELVYTQSSGEYEISGDVTISFDDESINTTIDFEFTTSEVTLFSFGLTTDFTIEDLTFSPDDLTFEYDSTDEQFELYGSATVTVDDNSITISLGDSDTPGIVIDDGTLTSINAGISADFTIKDLTISPSDLTFVYSKDDDQFEIYGDLSISFDDEEIDASFGDSDNPGFIYKDSEVTQVNISVTTDFSIKSLEIVPDDLTFEYDTVDEEFEMYGDITFKIGDDEVDADLGDSDNPGLIIDSGTITEINIGVTEDFSFSGLEVEVTDVGVLWNSGTEFYLYGDAALSIDSDSIDVDFGTSSDPGLVIEDGSLKSFSVDVNSDLTLGNLEVETVDLEINYTDDIFEITGEVEITEVFSVSVTFGGDEADGLEIDVSGSEPTLKVDGITIEIDSADLGAIDIKSLVLEFDSDGIEEASVKVSFPEGWEVDATLTFTGDPATLDSIDIAFEVTNLDDAIEIFEGLELTYLEGSVENLTDTSNLKVSGTITTIYGGGVTIGSESVTWIETSETVTITSSEFDISADVNVGAYLNSSGTNSWSSVLGDGSIDLDVVYGDYVEATVNIDIPSDPFIEADATVFFSDGGDFDALLDVTFYVPSDVPFIGGDELGSVSGAIRYLSDDISSSYAAAWTSGTLVFVSYTVGAKYEFESGDVSIFTSGTEAAIIEADIDTDIATNSRSANSVKSKIYSFEIEDNAPRYMMVDIDWADEVDNALITVIGPEGTYELTKADIEDRIDTTVVPTFTYNENMTTVFGEESTTFIFNSPSSMTAENVIHSQLMKGRYQVVISFLDTETEIDNIQFLPYYQAPSIESSAEKNTTNNKFDLTADYWSSFPDSTYVSFYVNNVNSTINSRLIQHVKASNFDDEGYGSETISYSPHFFTSNSENLYFYTVVDDGSNPPVTSEISQAFIHNPDLYGQLSFQGTGSALNLTGLRVFIDADDDGSFDTASTGGLEEFDISNADGTYSFKGLENGTYNLRIVLPRGYRLVGGVDRYSSISFTYDGTPLELNLAIEAH